MYLIFQNRPHGIQTLVGWTGQVVMIRISCSNIHTEFDMMNV